MKAHPLLQVSVWVDVNCIYTSVPCIACADPSDVFRSNIDTLSDAIGTSNNCNRIANKFFAKGLLPLSLVEDITTTTSYSAYDKGNRVVLQLYKQLRASTKPRDTLYTICEVLEQQDDQLKDIGHSMRRRV